MNNLLCEALEIPLQVEHDIKEQVCKIMVRDAYKRGPLDSVIKYMDAWAVERYGENSIERRYVWFVVGVYIGGILALSVKDEKVAMSNKGPERGYM